MRPLTLTLAGLQSYREEQRVDFSTLCEAGVFGIFGPTGSGKSTILDAITLALYGRVERASNETQGILNQAEDRLAVSFSFQLTHASGNECYRVERQYKRASEVSVNLTLCRLIEITPEGERVLADKRSDVNAYVQQLLGLSIHDFTRAVVLPQGKFAEFLALKGKERREMLQRLFHLEQYGDQLAQRLQERVRRVESRLQQLIAEQQGLGDASPQALEVAEQHLQAALAQELSLKEAAKAAEQEWEASRELYQLSQEYRQLRAQFDKLQEQESHIVQQEERLAASVEAIALLPLLTERQQERQAASTALAEHQRLTETLQQIRQEDEASQHRYNEASQALITEEEPLLVQRERLTRAVELEQELGHLKAQSLEQNRIVADQTAVCEALGEQVAKRRERMGRGAEKQRQLKDEVAAMQVDPAARRLLQEAQLARQELDMLAQQMNQQRQVVLTAQLAIQRHTDGYQAEQQQAQQIWMNLEPLLQDVLHDGQHLQERQDELINWQARYADLLAEAHKQDQANATGRYAALLATQLVDHEPCPVCGSLDHPNQREDALSLSVHSVIDSINAAQSDSNHKSEAEVEAANQLRSALTTAIGEAIYALRATVGRIDDTRRLWQEDREQTPQLAAWLESASSGQSFDVDLVTQAVPARKSGDTPPPVDVDFPAFAAAWETYALTLTAQREAAEARLAQARLQVRQLQATAGTLAQQAAEQLRLQRQYEDASDEQSAREAALDQMRLRWESRFPQYAAADTATLAADAERLEVCDREREEHMQRIERSVSFLEEEDRAIRELEQQLHASDKTRLLAEQSHQTLQAQHAAKFAEWQALAPDKGEGGAAEALRLTQARLTQLRDDVRRSETARESARRARDTHEQQYVRVEQAAAAASQAAERAAARFAQALADSRFAEEAAVAAAALAAEAREQLRQATARYREQQLVWRDRLKELATRLDGRELSEARYVWLQERLDVARAQYNGAIEQRAACRRDRDDLAVRHNRWQVLEQERQVSAEQQERHHLLQKVFRGNSFVEFIAEEQLLQVSRAASERLADLTRQRYALEVDSTGGFVIRDDANGGVRRPVSSLSGGETFLTSLALALALSAQIQLRGKYPLEFFFLDEGFGTLDAELLDGVVSALERLHADQLAVGVISHVPELQARLPRKLVIQPAEHAGAGSRIRLETQ